MARLFRHLVISVHVRAWSYKPGLINTRGWVMCVDDNNLLERLRILDQWAPTYTLNISSTVSQQYGAIPLL